MAKPPKAPRIGKGGGKRRRISAATRAKISLGLARALGPTRGLDPYEAIGAKPAKSGIKDAINKAKVKVTPKPKAPKPAAGGAKPPSPPHKPPTAPAAAPSPGEGKRPAKMAPNKATRKPTTPAGRPDNSVAGGGRQASPNFLLPERIREEKGYKEDLTTLRSLLASGKISPKEFLDKYQGKVDAAKRDQGLDDASEGYGRNRGAQREEIRLRTLGQDAGLIDKQGKPKAQAPDIAPKAAAKPSGTDPDTEEFPTVPEKAPGKAPNAPQGDQQAPDTPKGETGTPKQRKRDWGPDTNVAPAEGKHSKLKAARKKINDTRAQIKRTSDDHNIAVRQHPGMDHTRSLKLKQRAEKDEIKARQRLELARTPATPENPRDVPDFVEELRALKIEHKRQHLQELGRRKTAIKRGHGEKGSARPPELKNVARDQRPGAQKARVAQLNAGQGTPASSRLPNTLTDPPGTATQRTPQPRRKDAPNGRTNAQRTPSNYENMPDQPKPDVTTGMERSGSEARNAQPTATPNYEERLAQVAPRSGRKALHLEDIRDATNDGTTRKTGALTQAEAMHVIFHAESLSNEDLIGAYKQSVQDFRDAPSTNAKYPNSTGVKEAYLRVVQERRLFRRPRSVPNGGRGNRASGVLDAPAGWNTLDQAESRIIDSPHYPGIESALNGLESAYVYSLVMGGMDPQQAAQQARRERIASPRDPMTVEMAKTVPLAQLKPPHRPGAERFIRPQKPAPQETPATLPNPEETAGQRSARRKKFSDWSDEELATELDDINNSEDGADPRSLQAEIKDRELDTKYTNNPKIKRNKMRESSDDPNAYGDAGLADMEKQRKLDEAQDTANTLDLDTTTAETPEQQQARRKFYSDRDDEDIQNEINTLRKEWGDNLDNPNAIVGTRGEQAIFNEDFKAHQGAQAELTDRANMPNEVEAPKYAPRRDSSELPDAYEGDNLESLEARRASDDASEDMIPDETVRNMADDIAMNADEDDLNLPEVAALERLEANLDLPEAARSAISDELDRIDPWREGGKVDRMLSTATLAQVKKKLAELNDTLDERDILNKMAMAGHDDPKIYRRSQEYSDKFDDWQREKMRGEDATGGDADLREAALSGKDSKGNQLDFYSAIDRDTTAVLLPPEMENHFQRIGYLPNQANFRRTLRNENPLPYSGRDGVRDKARMGGTAPRRSKAEKAMADEKKARWAAMTPAEKKAEKARLRSEHEAIVAGQKERAAKHEANAKAKTETSKTPQPTKAPKPEVTEAKKTAATERTNAKARARAERTAKRKSDAHKASTKAAVEKAKAKREAKAAEDAAEQSNARVRTRVAQKAARKAEEHKASVKAAAAKAKAKREAKQAPTPEMEKPQPQPKPKRAPKGEQGTLAGIEHSAIAAAEGDRELPGIDAVNLSNPTKKATPAKKATPSVPNPYGKAFDAVKANQGKDGALTDLTDKELTLAQAEASKPATTRSGSRGTLAKRRVSQQVKAEQDRRLTPEQRQAKTDAAKKATEAKTTADAKTKQDFHDKVAANKAKIESDAKALKESDAKAGERIKRLEAEHAKGGHRAASDAELLAAAKTDDDAGYLARRELSDRGYKGETAPDVNVRRARDLNDGRAKPEDFTPQQLEDTANALNKSAAAAAGPGDVHPKIGKGAHGQVTDKEMGLMQLAGVVRQAAKDRKPDAPKKAPTVPGVKKVTKRKATAETIKARKQQMVESIKNIDPELRDATLKDADSYVGKLPEDRLEEELALATKAMQRVVDDFKADGPQFDGDTPVATQRKIDMINRRLGRDPGPSMVPGTRQAAKPYDRAREQARIDSNAGIKSAGAPATRMREFIGRKMWTKLETDPDIAGGTWRTLIDVEVDDFVESPRGGKLYVPIFEVDGQRVRGGKRMATNSIHIETRDGDNLKEHALGGGKSPITVQDFVMDDAPKLDGTQGLGEKVQPPKAKEAPAAKKDTPTAMGVSTKMQRGEALTAEDEKIIRTSIDDKVTGKISRNNPDDGLIDLVTPNRASTPQQQAEFEQELRAALRRAGRDADVPITREQLEQPSEWRKLGLDWDYNDPRFDKNGFALTGQDKKDIAKLPTGLQMHRLGELDPNAEFNLRKIAAGHSDGEQFEHDLIRHISDQAGGGKRSLEDARQIVGRAQRMGEQSRAPKVPAVPTPAVKKDVPTVREGRSAIHFDDLPRTKSGALASKGRNIVRDHAASLSNEELGKAYREARADYNASTKDRVAAARNAYVQELHNRRLLPHDAAGNPILDRPAKEPVKWGNGGERVTFAYPDPDNKEKYTGVEAAEYSRVLQQAGMSKADADAQVKREREAHPSDPLYAGNSKTKTPTDTPPAAKESPTPKKEAPKEETYDVDNILEALNRSWANDKDTPEASNNSRRVDGKVTPEDARPGDLVDTPYGKETIIAVNGDMVTTTVNNKRDDSYTFNWDHISGLDKNGDLNMRGEGTTHYKELTSISKPQPAPRRTVDPRDRKTFFTTEDLRNRGWTDAQIKEHIGTADGRQKFRGTVVADEKYSGHNLNLFNRDRVTWAEGQNKDLDLGEHRQPKAPQVDGMTISTNIDKNTGKARFFVDNWQDIVGGGEADKDTRVWLDRTGKINVSNASTTDTERIQGAIKAHMANPKPTTPKVKTPKEKPTAKINPLTGKPIIERRAASTPEEKALLATSRNGEVTVTERTAARRALIQAGVDIRGDDQKRKDEAIARYVPSDAERNPDNGGLYFNEKGAWYAPREMPIADDLARKRTPQGFIYQAPNGDVIHITGEEKGYKNGNVEAVGTNLTTGEPWSRKIGQNENLTVRVPYQDVQTPQQHHASRATDVKYPRPNGASDGIHRYSDEYNMANIRRGIADDMIRKNPDSMDAPTVTDKDVADHIEKVGDRQLSRWKSENAKRKLRVLNEGENEHGNPGWNESTTRRDTKGTPYGPVSRQYIQSTDETALASALMTDPDLRIDSAGILIKPEKVKRQLYGFQITGRDAEGKKHLIRAEFTGFDNGIQVRRPLKYQDGSPMSDADVKKYTESLWESHAANESLGRGAEEYQHLKQVNSREQAVRDGIVASGKATAPKTKTPKPATPEAAAPAGAERDVADTRKVAEYLATDEGKAKFKAAYALYNKPDYQADSARADALTEAIRAASGREDLASYSNLQDSFEWRKIARTKDPAKIEAYLQELFEVEAPAKPTTPAKRKAGDKFTDADLDSDADDNTAGRARKDAEAKGERERRDATRAPEVASTPLQRFPDLAYMDRGMLLMLADGNSEKAKAVRELLAQRD